MNIFYKGRFHKGSFEINDGKFSRISITGDEDVNDKEYVIPGCVDIHTHGRTGDDFSFADKEALRRLCASYAKAGITSVLSTTMTNEETTVINSIRAAGEYISEGLHENEARLYGIHMEGPFISNEKKFSRIQAFK